MLLLFALAMVAQADPITLNVTSWSFLSYQDATVWGIQAADAAGKTVTISDRTGAGYYTSITDKPSFISGLPYSSATILMYANATL